MESGNEDDGVRTGGERSGAETPLIDSSPRGLTQAQAFNLYLSHALSTWNARGYEFAAILFTAAAYPDTLVAAALRMIIIYLSMIAFSSSVAHWVERSPNRLRTLLSTICVNRVSVILGSFVWLLILSSGDMLENEVLKGVVFAIAITFGIIERLSASANLISMERDWVVVAAAPIGNPRDLTNLNAVMRRIDLVCKLVSPIFISVIVSATGGDARVGVLYTGLASLVCLPIEFVSAKRVWDGCAALQAPKPTPDSADRVSGATEETDSHVGGARRGRLREFLEGFEIFFSSPVWIPSLALAMLHFNMLTWRATFITYLINIGYSLNVITAARAVSSVFEIGSTAVTPRGIVYLGKTSRRHHAVSGDESEVGLLDQESISSDTPVNDAETIVGLQRLGLWGISSQFINTIPVVLALWMISNDNPNPQTTDPTTTTPPSPHLSTNWSLILFSFLALSRLGVWIYDLTTSQLAQTLVDSRSRARFAGAESVIVNVFEVLGAGAAIAFPRPEQYRWLALASLVSVAVAWCLCAMWVRGRRGHLVHWEKVGGGCGRG